MAKIHFNPTASSIDMIFWEFIYPWLDITHFMWTVLVESVMVVVRGAMEVTGGCDGGDPLSLSERASHFVY